MGEIKSALEIALEKADRLGRLSKEELEAQKWNEQGRRIAADYLNGKIDEMQQALGSVPAESLQAALDGAAEVLLRNIILPQDDLQWQGIKRAMDGLVAIKGSIAMQVLPQMEQLLRNYQQTINHYQEQFQQHLKSRMEAIKQMGQGAAGAQMGGGMDASELNSLMQAQEEWNRLAADIRQQFEQQLEPLKNYLRQ
jgi:hypothetical protein